MNPRENETLHMEQREEDVQRGKEYLKNTALSAGGKPPQSKHKHVKRLEFKLEIGGTHRLLFLIFLKLNEL